jgi:hypothetical protein
MTTFHALDVLGHGRLSAIEWTLIIDKERKNSFFTSTNFKTMLRNIPNIFKVLGREANHSGEVSQLFTSIALLSSSDIYHLQFPAVQRQGCIFFEENPLFKPS